MENSIHWVSKSDLRREDCSAISASVTTRMKQSLTYRNSHLLKIQYFLVLSEKELYPINQTTGDLEPCLDVDHIPTFSNRKEHSFVEPCYIECVAFPRNKHLTIRQRFATTADFLARLSCFTSFYAVKLENTRLFEVFMTAVQETKTEQQWWIQMDDEIRAVTSNKNKNGYVPGNLILLKEKFESPKAPADRIIVGYASTFLQFWWKRDFALFGTITWIPPSFVTEGAFFLKTQ